ncbi:loganic acid O-methyltransferase-like [Aristolochia californica]|uniref:loganic acid O-methyltransferase-like n=1 Tax=Aristolochia californica TaxID=171875 RepID=UPI0035E0E967
MEDLVVFSEMKAAEKEDRVARQETRSCSMNGGDGPNSYARNSTYQRSGSTTALTMIKEVIAKDLNMKDSPTNPGEPFCIAELGRSAGPNTFLLVGTIIEAVKLKYYESHGNLPEFQAFFNDIASNDFNTLIRSPLWDSHLNFAATVPGSFHGRLFPKASLHFVHCSYALHWLSELPKEVMNENSPAWNKGKITCFGAKREVSAAFLGQFAVVLNCFLLARADEIFGGGSMALARLDEDQVDSFNLPAYLPTADEFGMLVEENGSFSMEMMQPLTIPNMAFDARVLSALIRAITEVIMSTQFGSEIIDEIFDIHRQKIEESSHLIIQSMEVSQYLFVLLKRKPN